LRLREYPVRLEAPTELAMICP